MEAFSALDPKRLLWWPRPWMLERFFLLPPYNASQTPGRLSNESIFRQRREREGRGGSRRRFMRCRFHRGVLTLAQRTWLNFSIQTFINCFWIVILFILTLESDFLSCKIHPRLKGSICAVRGLINRKTFLDSPRAEFLMKGASEETWQKLRPFYRQIPFDVNPRRLFDWVCSDVVRKKQIFTDDWFCSPFPNFLLDTSAICCWIVEKGKRQIKFCRFPFSFRDF